MRFRDDEPGNLVRARAAVAAGRAEHPDGAEASSPEPDWATDPPPPTPATEALTRHPAACVSNCLGLGKWTAERRDTHETLRDETPLGLREKIIADYASRRVPRSPSR